jgi:uncharacterized membrane protein
MSWYDLFKFVHVAASIVWVGGGLTFVALVAMANRRGEQAEVLRIFKTMVPYANRVFMQAAIVALVSGVVMLLILPQIGWGSPWILFGILGFAVTGYLGGSQLGPRTARIIDLEAKEGASPATMALVAEVTQIARFDIILLFTIVADMVIKPMWPNWIVVILFLAIVAGAGYYFLAPILRPPVAQPPTTQPPVSA